MASGFPWVMIGSAMSAWLAEEGISRTNIGFFGFIFVAYSVNFLWSPFLDRLKIPFVTNFLGQRRSWIVITQLCVAVMCYAISSVEPSQDLNYAKIIAFGLALASATQDIAIDAFRIDSLPVDESRLMAAGSAMATAGWWTGFAGLGAIPLLLIDLNDWNWSDVYQMMSLMMLVLVIVPLWSPEPKTDREKIHSEMGQRYLAFQLGNGNSAILQAIRQILIWLMISFVEPMTEFFRRNGVRFALSILLFIFMFKIGEAFLGRMSVVFYKEVGFSNTDIALYSKLISWWVTIIFSMIGSLVTIRYGILKGLFIGGFAMGASNLMFALLAMVGPDKGVLVAAVIVDGFTSAWSTVAFVAFLSMMCNRAFTASQYALMASLGTLGRTLLASYSGLLVDVLDGGWEIFFTLTAVMVLPSLLLLYKIRHRLKAMAKEF